MALGGGPRRNCHDFEVGNSFKGHRQLIKVLISVIYTFKRAIPKLCAGVFVHQQDLLEQKTGKYNLTNIFLLMTIQSCTTFIENLSLVFTKVL